MFEVFLFVNPIGIKCYQSEREIITAFHQAQTKATYHFVPLANMTSIRADMLRRGISNNNLHEFNRFSQATFSALRDYHALKLLVGNKKARKYLLTLQNEINVQNQIYSIDLAHQLVKKMGISAQLLDQTKKSPFIENSMLTDLDLAHKFGVERTPTTVIFDYDNNDSGIMFEGCIDHNDLIETIANREDFKRNNHLHII